MSRSVNFQRMYRDTLRRKVSGVCAGVAKHFGFEPWMVRLAAIALFIFMPVPVAIAYVLAVVLIPAR